jgi:outer membrane protein
MNKTLWRFLPYLSTCAAILQSGRAAAEQQATLEERLAPSPGGGLTADQVAARAQETSFDAAARREAIHAAEARLGQAQVAYYPKLTFTGRYTRLSPITQPDLSRFFGPPAMTPTMPAATTTPVTFPVYLDQYVFQAGLVVPLSDYVLRLSQSYASASRSKRAAVLDEQASRLKSSVDGRDAYYAWLRSRAQVIVAERALDQSKGHLDDARHAFDVGTTSKADVLRVESQVASAELVLERAKNLAALTEDQIRTAMHDPSTQPYGIGEDLRTDLAPMSGTHDLAALRAEALDRRLEVRALDETAWSLREQAKAARAGYYPRLDAFGDLIYANPNPRYFPADGTFKLTWDVGLQVVWSPNDTFGAASTVSESEARAAQTDMQKAALRDSVKLEVMQAYNALRDAEVAVSTSKRGLTAAEEGYRVRRELFRNGRATSVELTDSEVELFRASLESVNARADLRSARARLMHATGRDVPAGLAQR